MLLQYTGAARHRTISKDDFARYGVEDQDAIAIDTAVSAVAEVTDAAAALLINAEPNDWRVVPEKAYKAEQERIATARRGDAEANYQAAIAAAKEPK